MRSVKLIQHFNRINGNQLTLATAKELHAQVTKELDSNGHGPCTTALKEVQSKLAKFMKMCTAENITRYDRIEFEPVQYHPGMGLKELIQVGRKELGKVERKKSTPEKVDESFLHGLPCIQNDADYQGKQLGAIGDTTYKVITDKILSLIQKDGLIWRKPWNTNHAGKESHAHNYVTKTYYRGANFYLNYLLMSDFESPYFFTFKQVDQLGGKIKSGSKGWPVIYFKWLYKRTGGALVDETEALAGGKLKEGYEKFPALFYYTVFNHEQTEGVKVKPFKKATLTLKEKIESCETIVANMPQRPPIKNVSGDRAFYVPSTDNITMPLMEQFKQEQEYYCTLFHELIHSTGHYERLQRDLKGKFGSKSYALEELIAELGASFLCGESGIFYFTMNNSAAYIKNWSKKLVEQLTEDNKFFVKAAAAAEKASEFILSGKKTPVVKKDTDRKPVKKLETKLKKAQTVSGIDTTKKKAKPVKNENHSGVSYTYHPIDLGPYQKDFHRMYSDTIVQVHGLPGHGKTVYELKLADYLSKSYNVLYVAREEYGRSVFDIKLKEQNISAGKNLRFKRKLEKSDIEWAQVIFLDSVNALKLSHEDVEDLSIDYPNRNWHLVMQSTKDGGFRGSMEWEHLVDIAGEIHNRKMILRKNRLDANNHTKMSKLQKEDAIAEAKKKAEIREAVKASTKNKVEPTKQEL